MASNTLSLRDSIIAEVREQQQPVMEAAAAAATLNARMDTAAAQAAAADVKAQRAETRVYDTRAFASVQATIDEAFAAGGGTVFVADNPPPGLDITLRDGVYLTGRGIGVTTWNVNTITGAGTTTALPDISVNANANTRQVTFAAPHGLVAGDIFFFQNTTDFSFNAADGRPYYRAGEFCKVKSVVSSTVVKLTAPLYDTYRTTDPIDLYKVTPIRTGVSNMTITCTPGRTGIYVQWGTDLEFRNLRMRGTDQAHITIARSYEVEIEKITAFDNQAEVGLNYGVVIASSQRVRIDKVTLETSRHGLATGHWGSGTGIGTIPVRDLVVSNSYINGLSDTEGVCGCNLHGNSEHVRFENCTFPSGANPAGDHIEYRNCKFGSAAWGSAVSCMEMLGVNLSFIGCTFTARDNQNAQRGLIYLRFPVSCVRPHGRLVFADNIVDLGTTTVATGGTVAVGVVLSMESNTGTVQVRQAVIGGNTFDAATLTDRSAIRIITTGTDKWTGIDYVRNTGRLAPQFRFDEAGTPVYFDGHGPNVPTFVAQHGSRYMRRVTSGTDTGLLYINQSGTATWTAK